MKKFFTSDQTCTCVFAEVKIFSLREVKKIRYYSYIDTFMEVNY